jgi:hypothetical protein
MKKLFVFLVAVGYCIASIAAEPISSWILSNAGKMNVKKINLGVFKAKIVKSLPFPLTSSIPIQSMARCLTNFPCIKMENQPDKWFLWNV